MLISFLFSGRRRFGLTAFAFLCLLAVGALLSGCGGGGSPTTPGRNTQKALLQARINWSAGAASGSPQSVLIIVRGGKPDGSSLTWNINRKSAQGATSYTSSEPILAGLISLRVTFMDQADGKGNTLGAVDALTSVDAQGGGVPSITLGGTITHASMPHNQIVPLGKTALLSITAANGNSELVAAKPQDYTYQIVDGTDVLAANADGTFTPLKEGQATVTVKAGDVAAGTTTVTVAPTTYVPDNARLYVDGNILSGGAGAPSLSGPTIIDIGDTFLSRAEITGTPNIEMVWAENKDSAGDLKIATSPGQAGGSQTAMLTALRPTRYINSGWAVTQKVNPLIHDTNSLVIRKPTKGTWGVSKIVVNAARAGTALKYLSLTTPDDRSYSGEAVILDNGQEKHLPISLATGYDTLPGARGGGLISLGFADANFGNWAELTLGHISIGPPDRHFDFFGKFPGAAGYDFNTIQGDIYIEGYKATITLVKGGGDTSGSGATTGGNGSGNGSGNGGGSGGGNTSGQANYGQGLKTTSLVVATAGTTSNTASLDLGFTDGLIVLYNVPKATGTYTLSDVGNTTTPYAIIQVSSGTFSTAGNVGSNNTVSVTSVSATSMSGTFAFSATDFATGSITVSNGAFTVPLQ